HLTPPELSPMMPDVIGRSRAEVADLFEEPADLAGPEAAVAAEGADGRDLPGPGPARHGLGVDPEHDRHFAGGEQFVLSHRFLHGRYTPCPCSPNWYRFVAVSP